MISLRAVESMSAKALRMQHYYSLGSSETKTDHLPLWKSMTDCPGCILVQMSREDKA